MSPPPRRDLVNALNERFAAIAAWSFDHRWIVLGLCVGAVAGALMLAGNARIDNSYEAYFDPGDPAFRAYEQYREDFGSDEVSYILYSAPDAEHGAFDLGVMRQILSLTEALEEEVPFLYEVRSLTNAELIRGSEDGIEIAALEDDFPESQAELLALRDEYLARPMLVGGLVSADGLHGALILEMDLSSTDPLDAIRLDPEGGDGLENLYPQVTESKTSEILSRPEYEGLVFHVSGDVPLNAAYNRIIGHDSQLLFLITAGVIAAVLALAFRSLVGVLAPLAVVGLSVMFSMALIALLGWKLDLSFGATPTLLTAIGVAHAVHILSEFKQRFRELGDRREALIETIYLVGTPCLLTSLTTAAGFAAMGVVPIKSIAHMGVYSAFGVFAAFALSLTLLMALLSFGARHREPAPEVAPDGSAKGGARVRRILAAVAAFDLRHRKPILVAFALLFAASGVGMTRLVVDSNWLDDFSDRVPLKRDTQVIDEVMGGMANLIYVFDAGEPDGIKEPAALREIERVQEIARAQGGVLRKTYSLVDILKDLNQAFHGGDPDWYRLPETRELVAQYLLLYETSGGEEAEEHVSSDYRRAGLELRVAIAPVSLTADLVGSIEAELEQHPLEATSVTLTGIGALWLKLMDYIVSSQIQGFLLAFVAIGAMMVAIFRSFSLGTIAMLPNLSPVAVVLGTMGFAGVFLDYSKIMIAAVAIGIAVDDTIHLVMRYRHEFQRCGNYAQALEEALVDVGRALFITSVALVAGFLVLTLSVLASEVTQGLLLATTIVVALIADFFLMPALVLTFRPFGPEGADERSQALREAA